MTAPRYPKAKWIGQTMNTNGKFKRGLPDGITYHYTAAGSGAGSAKFLYGPHKPGSSATFVVDRDGTIYQLSDIDMTTWHAGISTWRGRSYMNNFFIGIETANYGYWRAELVKIIPDPVKAGWRKLTHKNESTPRYWEPYPEAQYKALEELTEWLLNVIPTIKGENMVGHDDIAPGRKSDPGPAFDMGRMKAVYEHVRHPKGFDPILEAYDTKLLPPASPSDSRGKITSLLDAAEIAEPFSKPHTDPEHRDENLSISKNTDDPSIAEVQDTMWYQSRFFWGLMWSLGWKAVSLYCGATPAKYNIAPADVQMIISQITLAASFIGDALMTHGRINAVRYGVARNLVLPFASTGANDNANNRKAA